MFCMQKLWHFLPKKCKSAKAPNNFSAKIITSINFVGTVRLNESSTNDFVELRMLVNKMFKFKHFVSKNSGIFAVKM